MATHGSKKLAIDIPTAAAARSFDRYGFDDTEQAAFSPPSPVAGGFLAFPFVNRHPSKFEGLNEEALGSATSPAASRNGTTDASMGAIGEDPFVARRNRRKSSLRIVDNDRGIAELELQKAMVDYNKETVSSYDAEQMFQELSESTEKSYDLGGNLKSDYSIADFHSPFRNHVATRTGVAKDTTGNSLVEKASQFGPITMATSVMKDTLASHGSILQKRVPGPAPEEPKSTTTTSDLARTLSSTAAISARNAAGSLSSFYKNFHPDSQRELNFMAPLSS